MCAGFILWRSLLQRSTRPTPRRPLKCQNKTPGTGERRVEDILSLSTAGDKEDANVDAICKVKKTSIIMQITDCNGSVIRVSVKKVQLLDDWLPHFSSIPAPLRHHFVMMDIEIIKLC
jgi:hypothetical protein